jgi:hypothetical protein
MFPFWTVTNANTSHTNERSSRYGSEENAIHEATERIKSGRTDAVVIMKAIKIVQRKTPPPIEVLEIL